MIFEKIKMLIVNQLGVDESEITELTTLEELGADSLDVLQMVMEFEDEFDVEISSEDVDEFKTIQDIVDYIEEN